MTIKIEIGSLGIQSGKYLAKEGIPNNHAFITNYLDLAYTKGFWHGKGNLQCHSLDTEGWGGVARAIPKRKVQLARGIIIEELSETIFSDERRILVAGIGGASASNIIPELMKSFDEKGCEYIAFIVIPHSIDGAKQSWDNALYAIEQMKERKIKPVIVDACRLVPHEPSRGTLPPAYLAKSIGLTLRAFDSGVNDPANFLQQLLSKSIVTYLYRELPVKKMKGKSLLFKLFDKVLGDLKFGFIQRNLISSSFMPVVNAPNSLKSLGKIKEVFDSAICEEYGSDCNIVDYDAMYTRTKEFVYSIYTTTNGNLIKIMKQRAGYEGE